MVVIDVIEEAIELVAEKADAFLTLLAHSQVAALAVNYADFSLLALQAGVLEVELSLLGSLGLALHQPLPLSHLVRVPFVYFPLYFMVGGLLVFLELLLKLFLLGEGDVGRVGVVLLEAGREGGGVDLQEVVLILHADLHVVVEGAGVKAEGQHAFEELLLLFLEELHFGSVLGAVGVPARGYLLRQELALGRLYPLLLFVRPDVLLRHVLHELLRQLCEDLLGQVELREIVALIFLDFALLEVDEVNHFPQAGFRSIASLLLLHTHPFFPALLPTLISRALSNGLGK